MKPMDIFDKCVVGVITGGHVVEHLKKRTSVKFARIIFYFKTDFNNKCLIEVTDRQFNLDNGEGMQAFCL